MINLNKNSRKLILLQRNELLSEKQRYLRKRFGRFIFTNILVNYFQIENLNQQTEDLFKKEFETFKDYLPEQINSILDIGCGLGIIHIFFKQKYNNHIKFFMLDKHKIDSSIKYGFSEDYESYNDLIETKNLLCNNGLNENQIYIKNVDEKIDINHKIDFIISLKSMCYHYPLENYLALLKKVCTKNTEFILDVTGGLYSDEFVEKYFEYSKVIYEEQSIHTLKRIYCKGFKFSE